VALFEQIEDDDLVFWAGALFVGYVFFNTWRNATATDRGGAVFGSQAPVGGFGDELLNVISPMQLSPAGESFIKKQEGWTAMPKGDAGGREVGWGHEILPGENIVGPITKAEGQNLFDGDAAIASAAVNNSVTVALTQNQFDALADFAYNEGAGALAGSTLVKYLNQGNYSQAAAQFANWNEVGHTVNQDLVNRRQQEQNLFNS
jgi:GH24 family phage-related lysozyme (muramidase)